MSSLLAGTNLTDAKDAEINHNDLHISWETIVLSGGPISSLVSVYLEVNQDGLLSITTMGMTAMCY